MKEQFIGFWRFSTVSILFIVTVLVGCDSQTKDTGSDQPKRDSQQALGSGTEPVNIGEAKVPAEAADSISEPEQSAESAEQTEKVSQSVIVDLKIPESAGSKVDRLTYIGYKLYQRVGCMKCHGPTAEGGAAFPNLLNSVKRLTREQIIEIAKNGKGIMPPAKDNAYLAKYTKKENMTVDQGFEAIYTYLSARSDGKIPAGKLEKPENIGG